MELLGVCTAVQLWGKYWNGLDVRLNCDNMGVVEILKRKCCNLKGKDLMELVRIICQSAVKNNCYFRVDHIKGLENKIADGLSRKENVNAIDRRHIKGNGYDCDGIIEYLLDCWNKNVPSKRDIIESERNVNYYMCGWDNYKKERVRNKGLMWRHEC